MAEDVNSTIRNPKPPRLVVGISGASGVIHGASLLYNLQLAELRGREDWIDLYRGRLAQWAAELDDQRLAAWSLAG